MGDDKNNLDVGLRNPPNDASAFLEGSESDEEKDEIDEADNAEDSEGEGATTSSSTNTTSDTTDDGDETVQCTIYLDADVKRRLKTYCDEQGRTQSWTTQHVLEQFLEEEGY